MKPKITTLLLLAGTIFLFSFSGKHEIGKCYISFDNATDLKLSATNRLPENSDKFRKVSTENGDATISRLDGYRILYNNKKNATFVNLKVELSDPGSYGKDTANILSNLKYLNHKDEKDMETTDLIQQRYNGYIIYGLSRKSIEEGYILGSFVMFPGNNIIVYFYFQNIKPDYRQFDNLNDYKRQRNGFLGLYTFYLRDCKDK